ncbi:glucosamine-6-phosphate deaminase [Lachnospiraceae bacterium 29-84]
MRIIQTPDYNGMSIEVARIIAAQLSLKPDCVLGLATGSTPTLAYQYLSEWGNQWLDFSKATSVNLDEYRGLPKDHEQSYHYFMQKHLFQNVPIRPNRTFLPDGMEPDIERACQDYDDVIRYVGGIDLQLLGLGHNGHIGFNEPDTCFAKGTHCVDLSEQTIQANKRFFQSEDDVPRQAYTMGIKNILSARRILIAVSGKDKAHIVKEAFFGPVTPQVPASILQFHQDATLVADKDALSECEGLLP